MATALEQFGKVLSRETVHYRDKPFILRAGGESHWYVDLRKAFGKRALSTRMARQVLQLTAGADYDMVAGIGIGGRALAIGTMALGGEFPYRQGLEGIWGNDDTNEPPVDIDVPDKRGPEDRDDRIDPKNGYGFSPGRVGGRQVLAVDDTFTTGDSMVTLVDMLRESGATVDDVAVVADRSNGRGAEVARSLGVTVHRLFEFQETSGLLVPAAGPFTPDSL